MLRHIIFVLLFLGLFLFSESTAFAKKDDVAQARSIGRSIGLNEDGLEWVHQKMKAMRVGRKTLDPEEIVELCNEAKGMRRFLQNGGKCMSRAKKAARIAKRGLGPAGVFLTVIFIAEDVRADGVCLGVARNVPGVDVVIDGNQTIDEVFEVINEWSSSRANAHVDISHMVAGAIIGDFDGWSGDADTDPIKVLNCYGEFYDALQSAIYLRIVNDDIHDIDWSFISPRNSNFPQAQFDNFYSCIDKAKLPPMGPVCCCSEGSGCPAD